jgi:hypothetical protein
MYIKYTFKGTNENTFYVHYMYIVMYI